MTVIITLIYIPQAGESSVVLIFDTVFVLDEGPGGDNHKFPMAVEQLSDSKLESIVEDLLAAHARDVVEGVQVAAQWVLSLNHNSPYLQLKPNTGSTNASAASISGSHDMNKEILQRSCQPIQVRSLLLTDLLATAD